MAFNSSNVLKELFSDILKHWLTMTEETVLFKITSSDCAYNYHYCTTEHYINIETS